jgi:hypothetical protein
MTQSTEFLSYEEENPDPTELMAVRSSSAETSPSLS